MVGHEHKSLNQLYRLFVERPIHELSELMQTLCESKQQVISCLNRLKAMGLDLIVDNEKAKLNHLIDFIELDFLQKKLQQNHIDKPVYYHFTTLSTNLLASKDKAPSIYIGDYQSQGKGRHNKTWVTPLGQSVALSIGHAFDCGLSEISGLNIAIGVAILKTIEQFGSKGVGLKWPNDVMGKNGKIAGILIEASGNNKSCFVVIGIGLNWNVRQSILDKVDRECMNVGLKGVTRTQFLAALIVNVHQLIQDFSQRKLKNMLPIWNKHDCYTGKMINIIQENKAKPAKYIGINPQGYLSVEIQGQTKLLASGEVTIRLS